MFSLHPDPHVLYRYSPLTRTQVLHAPRLALPNLDSTPPKPTVVPSQCLTITTPPVSHMCPTYTTQVSCSIHVYCLLTGLVTFESHSTDALLLSYVFIHSTSVPSSSAFFLLMHSRMSATPTLFCVKTIKTRPKPKRLSGAARKRCPPRDQKDAGQQRSEKQQANTRGKPTMRTSNKENTRWLTPSHSFTSSSFRGRHLKKEKFGWNFEPVAD